MGRRRIVMPVLDGCPLFALATACEVFGRDRRYLTPEWYELVVCAAAPGLPVSVPGLLLEVGDDLDVIETADLVVVTPPPHPSYRPPGRLLTALRAAHRRGVRIASLCTGAFILAAAGLLDGREVATDHDHADELRRRYPLVNVNEQALYVDNRGILSSAGTAATIDLCLHIVRQDFGAAAAAEIGRRMVVAPHRDGVHSQYAPLAPPGLAQVLDWAQQRLHEPLTIPQLAERAAMSTRSFGRQFVDETGITPTRWLTLHRLANAQALLESTDLSVDSIAARTGFTTGNTLRLHFKRHIGSTPSAYRRAFRAGA
ncbi:GlxA family transcriptional regulator [Kibdelosporangium phytohabitans]|uniref:AraC family transcriptional regulator n=1 Tax=Kibdelosporangium phytohabitans TaxID=860235 RepID=A0A0N9I2D5_9PSEU|nr:helix-turn-helix domain-containing protein [Kibdelosporangium phytohabitans]ALG08610.1 AraC family transcriptional regulator [Kibdelosporangium phytohabitans]MBE1470306.1 transcriptional regulator GlxA family with amidase domain [Kibdelosporangium phytohabitans]